MLLLVLFCQPCLAVTIDGHVTQEEWAQAQHITDFRKVMPLTGEKPTLQTEAWVLATPEGLAVAFRNYQPLSIPRTNQRVPRDFDAQVDRINVIVDFEGDRRTAFEFTVSSTNGIFDGVVTDERYVRPDWDGDFRHATSQDDEGWRAEVLLPWHLATMRESTAATRTINLYLDRVVAATGERVAWPLASFEKTRFISDFAPIEVRNFRQPLFAVTPYLSHVYDNIDKQGKPSAGADVFWKPSGKLQLAATVKPDFGQVESDDLIVNFDATETFIADKRPFFTENQSIFEFTTPSDSSQLLYTRRVGAPSDDGAGATDITAALKVNGNLGATKYGVFAAKEDDAAGRSFGALRVLRNFSNQNLGLMLTDVKRPFLDREATVLGIDQNWRPSARVDVRTRLIGSSIREHGQNSEDAGQTLLVNYEMNDGWRQQWEALHFGNDLQLNDAGYLYRNNENYLHWQVNRRITSTPQSSIYASEDWGVRVLTDHNDQGALLEHQLQINRESRWKNGSYEYWQLHIHSSGVDDLLTRGNGSVDLPAHITSYLEFARPRKGNWSYELRAELNGGGLSGNHRAGVRFQFEPTYYLTDAFNVHVGLDASRKSDWLVWQHDNYIGSFKAKQIELSAGFHWTITESQELRLKLQAIALSADAHQGYRVSESGAAIRTNEPLDDFVVQNLGVQLRYRYELAPLSYLYVVYGRGGYDAQLTSRSTDGLLGDSFNLRDDDQLLIKLSYRFEP